MDNCRRTDRHGGFKTDPTQRAEWVKTTVALTTFTATVRTVTVCSVMINSVTSLYIITVTTVTLTTVTGILTYLFREQDLGLLLD